MPKRSRRKERHQQRSPKKRPTHKYESVGLKGEGASALSLSKDIDEEESRHLFAFEESAFHDRVEGRPTFGWLFSTRPEQTEEAPHRNGRGTFLLESEHGTHHRSHLGSSHTYSQRTDRSARRAGSAWFQAQIRDREDPRAPRATSSRHSGSTKDTKARFESRCATTRRMSRSSRTSRG